MKIEILYFDGCPNHGGALERVREVLKDSGVAAEITEVTVSDAAAATQLRFLGSPSIRINGVDVERSERSAEHFGMMCRTYMDGNVREGVPSHKMIRSAVLEAAAERYDEQDACRTCDPPITPTQPSRSKRSRWMFGGSIVAAIGASLCCVIPILSALTGLGMLALSRSFEEGRPYFLGATGTLLAGGILLAYRDRKKSCESGSICSTVPMSKWNLTGLVAVTLLVIAIALFPYYSAVVTTAVEKKVVSPPREVAGILHTVHFRVLGMSCAACAAGLEARLRRQNGVAGAAVDFGRRTAVVTYDPVRQSPSTLLKAVDDAGYRAIPAP